MYINYDKWDSYEYSLNSLYLDLNNPRIKYSGESLNQTQILKYLIKNEKVYELAKKISEEGYFVGEEPIICIENGKKVVLEGNRRTAALKLLQNPKKYLSSSKANTLIQNIAKNEINVNKKLRCYISPNRLLANPIIYERHNGATLQKWKTGNQYAFVAEMFYEDALAIEDICDVLNESRSKILKPLKAYNLFYEGSDVLEKEEGISLDISEFDFTNLERFYLYEPARKFLGIDFDNNTGELIIRLKREEFDKRILEVFKILIDSESFSREFNKEADKQKLIQKLNENPKFDFSSTKEDNTSSKTSTARANLEDEKNKTTTRKKRNRRKKPEVRIIPIDKEIVFDHDKLEDLFTELKYLPIDKKYSFAILLRSYLEQSLYFYLREKGLFDDLKVKTNERSLKNSKRKVRTLIEYIDGVKGSSESIDEERIMSILKFNIPKDFSNTSLKVMLDYIMNNELDDQIEPTELKSLKNYLERIKTGLDLAVHNLEEVVDFGHNDKAWKNLSVLFDILSTNLTEE